MHGSDGKRQLQDKAMITLGARLRAECLAGARGRKKGARDLAEIKAEEVAGGANQ